MADTNDDRFTRLEELVEITDRQVRTLAELQAQPRDIARLYEMWHDTHQDIARLYELWREDTARLNQAWTETREDIRRLYAAWPDHLRNGH